MSCLGRLLAGLAGSLLIASMASPSFAVTPRVAAAGSHSFGLKSDNSLWAWGSNDYGELGDGTTVESHLPKQVGTGFTAIASGGYHTVALKSDGSLWAWGYNGYGALGDGTATDSHIPKQIDSGYSAIAVGTFHTVALKPDGSLWTWGYNGHGALGDGTSIDSHVPKQIGVGYSAIAAGWSHTVALKSDGSVWAWGYNGQGQIGDGTTTDSFVPKQIGSGYAAIAAGEYHTLGVKADGGLWAWGNNGQGQLGDGTTTDGLTEKNIGSGFTLVAGGTYHSAALKSDGSLWMWGYNGYGELGDGSTTDSHVPKQIGTGYSAIAGGFLHTVALRSDGSLWAWGDNSHGQLGDGTADSLVPRQIATGYADAEITLHVVAGWNLLGNGMDAPLNVTTAFGRSDNVTSVWKWNALSGTWAYYTPNQTDGGASFAASRGYDALSTINAGEGYWVNAKQAFSVALAAGTPLPASGDQLRSGWNLVAIGETLTPRQYNSALGSDVNSLWAWETSQSRWYFYAPSLEQSNALTTHIFSKGYLDFTTADKHLGQTVGFWVYRVPTVSVGEAHSGQSIQLLTRQSLEIKLAENGSTGYVWIFDDTSIDVVAREGASLYVPDYPILTGSGGTSIWKFNAVKPGTGVLRLENRRLGEVGGDLAKAAQFVITVLPNATTTSTTTTTTTTAIPTTTTSSTTTTAAATTTTSATTTSSTATTTTTTATTTTTTTIIAPPCDFTTTTREWDFGAAGGDGWFSVQIVSSPCLIRAWDATGPAWISRIYTYGMSNGNGNVGFYVEPNNTGTAPISDRQGNVRVSWNGGLSFVNFLVKEKGANQFQGTLLGTWSGICRYFARDTSVSGNLRMDIDIDGGVTGVYAGDENGSINGSVNAATGGLATSGAGGTGGGSGGILWSGTFQKIGGTLSGGGTWTDSGDCSGTWGGP